MNLVHTSEECNAINALLGRCCLSEREIPSMCIQEDLFLHLHIVHSLVP